jgi:hypothetical protein
MIFNVVIWVFLIANILMASGVIWQTFLMRRSRLALEKSLGRWR